MSVRSGGLWAEFQLLKFLNKAIKPEEAQEAPELRSSDERSWIAS